MNRQIVDFKSVFGFDLMKIAVFGAEIENGVNAAGFDSVQFFVRQRRAAHRKMVGDPVDFIARF